MIKIRQKKEQLIIGMTILLSLDNLRQLLQLLLWKNTNKMKKDLTNINDHDNTSSKKLNTNTFIFLNWR